MLTEGTIPLMIEEEEAIRALADIYGDPSALRREDEGNSGALLATLADGSTWRVYRDGTIEEAD